jgi:ubiquinone/menaquinone biosynthesis C-methylase UbiE
VANAAMFEGSADAYDRFVGRYGRRLAATTLERAGVTSGQRILDVGCGPGPLAAQAAALVGVRNVSAVDPSQSFVDACRERLPEADVRVAAAESLPFADEEFDAVFAQLVVPFMTDAPAGAAEMARVAKPGGVVAATAWDYAGGMELLRAFWDAAAAVDPEGGQLDEGIKLGYAQPRPLSGLWSGAGLEDVDVSELVVEASYDDYDDLWTPFLAGIGPAGSYAVAQPPDRQEQLREQLRAELGAPEGPFTLSARAWHVTGTKAAA